MSSDTTYLFNDVFTLDTIDRDGKKFDRVSRLTALSTNHDMTLTLDVPLLPSSSS